MSSGKKKNENINPADTGKKHTAGGGRSEQGALGDLLGKGNEGSHISESREVLNPAAGAAAGAGAKPKVESVSASSVEADASYSPGLDRGESPVISNPQPAPKIVAAASAPTLTSATAPAAAAASPRIDIMGEIRGTTSNRFKRLPGETSSNLLITIALIMSMLVHVAIGVVMANQTAGKLPVALVDETIEQTFRVFSPPIDDPIYSDPVLNSEEAVAKPTRQPGVGELSKMLLLNKLEGSTAAIETPAPPKAAKIDHPDFQPPLPTADLSASTASMDLPSDITSKLAGGSAVELPIVTGSATSPVAAPTTSTEAGPSTTAQARSLLKGMLPSASTPGAPAGTGFSFTDKMSVPAPRTPTVADIGPTIDRGLLDATPTAPPIEVTAIALQEAQKLDIPERLDDDFDYAITKFRPEIGGGLFQSSKPDRYTYFQVAVTAKRSLRKLKTMPKDVIFLIDTSGSVPQSWVNGIAQGVRDALSTLNEGDRFNIVFFSEKTIFFADDKIATADSRTIASAQQFLTGAASKGNTDINRSLSRLLQRDTSAQRAYYLIFISDGVPTQGVMDTRELINLVTRDNDLNASIYCIGVGNNQNKELLNFLAYRNKGFSIFAKQSEQAAGSVRDLMSRIRYPIIKDVNLNVIGLDFEEVFPHNLPNIHQGETFNVYGRYETAGAFTMRVGGHNGHKAMDVTFGGDLLAAKTGEASLPENWAFWKLHHLYSEIIRQGEKQELKTKIKELKDRFDLKVLY